MITLNISLGSSKEDPWKLPPGVFGFAMMELPPEEFCFGPLVLYPETVGDEGEYGSEAWNCSKVYGQTQLEQ